MELIRYVLCPGCEMTTAAGGTVVPPDTGWRERGRSGPGAWGTRRGAANDAAAEARAAYRRAVVLAESAQAAGDPDATFDLADAHAALAKLGGR